MMLDLHKKWKLLKPDVAELSKEQRYETLSKWMNDYLQDIILAYRKETRRLI